MLKKSLPLCFMFVAGTTSGPVMMTVQLPDEWLDDGLKYKEALLPDVSGHCFLQDTMNYDITSPFDLLLCDCDCVRSKLLRMIFGNTGFILLDFR